MIQVITMEGLERPFFAKREADAEDIRKFFKKSAKVSYEDLDPTKHKKLIQDYVDNSAGTVLAYLEWSGCADSIFICWSESDYDMIFPVLEDMLGEDTSDDEYISESVGGDDIIEVLANWGAKEFDKEDVAECSYCGNKLWLKGTGAVENIKFVLPDKSEINYCSRECILRDCYPFFNPYDRDECGKNQVNQDLNFKDYANYESKILGTVTATMSFEGNERMEYSIPNVPLFVNHRYGTGLLNSIKRALLQVDRTGKHDRTYEQLRQLAYDLRNDINKDSVGSQWMYGPITIECTYIPTKGETDGR